MNSITCPQCGKTSFNSNDVANRYCGACSKFHSEMGPSLRVEIGYLELTPDVEVVNISLDRVSFTDNHDPAMRAAMLKWFKSIYGDL